MCSPQPNGQKAHGRKGVCAPTHSHNPIGCRDEVIQPSLRESCWLLQYGLWPLGADRSHAKPSCSRGRAELQELLSICSRGWAMYSDPCHQERGAGHMRPKGSHGRKGGASMLLLEVRGQVQSEVTANAGDPKVIQNTRNTQNTVRAVQMGTCCGIEYCFQ